MDRYRKRAEAEWSRVKPLKPGEDDPDKYGQRFRITHIMETLVERSGNIDALVEVKCRDLSSSYNFLQIAEIYRKANRDDQALVWAEKGMQIFVDKVDSRLQDLLAELYHRRKRHDEAMALIWPQFERHSSLKNYQKVKNHADRNNGWPEWRERALEHVRVLINTEARSNRDDHWRSSAWADRTLLVEIFVWEKDNEAAWKEAREGGCRSELWLQLASLREIKHPRDAVAVYQKLIGPIVERTNNDAYAEAADLLRRMEKLMDKLGENTEFRHYLAKVRTEFKRKRNFVKLLAKFK